MTTSESRVIERFAGQYPEEVARIYGTPSPRRTTPE